MLILYSIVGSTVEFVPDAAVSERIYNNTIHPIDCSAAAKTRRNLSVFCLHNFFSPWNRIFNFFLTFIFILPQPEQRNALSRRASSFPIHSTQQEVNTKNIYRVLFTCCDVKRHQGPKDKIWIMFFLFDNDDVASSELLFLLKNIRENV